MTTLENKIKFFETEFSADINENNGDTYASIYLNETPEFGDITEEMNSIWEKVHNRFPNQEGYEMGSIYDCGDYSFITFKIN